MGRRLLVLLAVVFGLMPQTGRAAATFVVTTSADGEGPCSGDHCTLREAIQAANSAPGADLITFSIPGSGPHTIQLIGDLPAIVDPVTIDGSSQPGFAGSPVIEIDGSLVSEPGAYASAFRVSAGPSIIKNLAINDFLGGDAIVVGGFSPIDDVVIQGNYIGTDLSGQADQGNFIGIGISNATNVLVGGDEPHERNLISGNYQGIFIGPGAGAGSRIQGNYIGTNAAGTQAVPNEGDGIRIDGSQYLIGGPTASVGNVIAGNGTGISLVTANAVDNLLQGNRIGVGATGGPLGNGMGIIIAMDPSRNTIGGAGSAANLVAHNAGTGILVQDAARNRFTENSIHSNQQLGIDLIVSSFQGRTPNDPDDADTGSNDLQNYPVIESAAYSGSTISIVGRINTVPSSTPRLEFFANSQCDPSDFGEGQTFLGAKDVPVNGDGDATFSVVFPAPAGAGNFITATATNPAGSTSEFSRCFDATGSPPGSTPSPSPTPSPTTTTSSSPSPSGTASPSPSPSGDPDPGCGWTIVEAGEGGGERATTFGIVTVNRTRAWAVGYKPDDRGHGHTYVKRWDGETWTRMPTPNPRGVHNELKDVAVSPNGDVWAVGNRTSGSALKTLVLRFAGGDWQVVDSPSPGVGLSNLNGVDVAPDGTVFAVGDSWDASGEYHGVILRRSEGRWHVVPGSHGALLHDVVAAGSRDVWAVGQTIRNGVSRTYVTHHDGSGWASVPSPNVNAKFHNLRGVTSAGRDELWAVGSHYGENRRSRPLILHYNGRRWVVADAPDLRGRVELWGVSAAGPDDAVAVGQVQGRYPIDSRAILEWDGSRWTNVQHDDNVSVQLWDVDLSPRGEAWVVGNRTGRPFTPYFEHRCGT